MADFVKNLFGGPKPAAPAREDSDFADYARAPPPAPPAAPSIPVPAGGANLAAPTPLPYTKWYRVWERASPGDFVLEAYVLPFALLILLFHVWGRRANRARARGWMAAHRPLLEQEYALVGFGAEAAQRAVRQALESVESEGLAKAMAREQEEAAAAAAGKGGEDAVERLKERAADDFETYATGRQNVACVDVRVTLLKRYNPLQLGAEYALAALFESFRAPAERATATAYAFDGHEKDMVPGDAPPPKGKGGNSSYDGFVWALVHKEQMRALRDERYDISLTATKDHAKLPAWATVMSESAEVTDALLTPELVAAVEQAGPDRFEHLIVSDQPLDKPTKLDDLDPRKRLTLSLRLPSGNSAAAYEASLPLFAYFLRLPDLLVAGAHFRAEVQKRLRATREEGSRRLRRAAEEEKAEERKAETDRKKKAERDARLKGMSAEEQRKFLEREREKDNRKNTKKIKG